MMTEVAQKLQFSDQPVIKDIYHENGTKIVAIGLKRGIEISQNLRTNKARLIVVQGKIDLNTATGSSRYACFESYDIPVKIKHRLVAWDDAIVLLFLNE